MTDQELRKLSRKDLLELLITQGRERDALQTELEQVKTALTNRQLQIEQAGSIAEASLQLNGVLKPPRLQRSNIWRISASAASRSRQSAPSVKLPVRSWKPKRSGRLTSS